MKSALKPKLILQLRPISAEASVNLAGLRTTGPIRRIAVSGFAVAALLAATPIAAQQVMDRDRCINADNTSAPDAVIEACTTLIEAYARGQIEPSDAATAYVGRGNAYAVMNERNLATADYDRAIAIYDRAIELASNDADIYLGRGNVSFLKRDYDRAISDYDKVLAIAPISVDAFLGRGRSFYQKKDYDRAIANYDRALGLDPNHTEALAERGDAHERSGRFERAVEDYGRLIVLQPANPKAWNNRCWDRA